MKKTVFSPQSQFKEIRRLLEEHYPEDFFKKSKEVVDLSLLFSLPQFQTLEEHSPNVICVLNHTTMQYEYFSENIKGMLGYGAERYKQPDGFEFALSTFNPAHAQIFSNQIVPKILECYNEYTSEMVKKLRFSFTFQCKKNTGEYIWCLQQISVLETNDQGFPNFTLVFMSDVTNIKKDLQLDFMISEKKADGSLLPILATTFIDHQKITFLSRRELEILSLIGKGLSTPQIAEQLFISTDTVYNHRKNMLEKTNTKNTAELLKMAMTKGVL